MICQSANLPLLRKSQRHSADFYETFFCCSEDVLCLKDFLRHNLDHRPQLSSEHKNIRLLWDVLRTSHKLQFLSLSCILDVQFLKGVIKWYNSPKIAGRLRLKFAGRLLNAWGHLEDVLRTSMTGFSNVLRTSYVLRTFWDTILTIDRNFPANTKTLDVFETSWEHPINSDFWNCVVF